MSIIKSAEKKEYGTRMAGRLHSLWESRDALSFSEQEKSRVEQRRDKYCRGMSGYAAKNLINKILPQSGPSPLSLSSSCPGRIMWQGRGFVCSSQKVPEIVMQGDG